MSLQLSSRIPPIIISNCTVYWNISPKLSRCIFPIRAYLHFDYTTINGLFEYFLYVGLELIIVTCDLFLSYVPYGTFLFLDIQLYHNFLRFPIKPPAGRKCFKTSDLLHDQPLHSLLGAIMQPLNNVLMSSTNLTTELEYFERFVFLSKLHPNAATSVSCHLSNLIRAECNTLSDTHTSTQGSYKWGKL